MYVFQRLPQFYWRLPHVFHTSSTRLPQADGDFGMAPLRHQRLPRIPMVLVPWPLPATLSTHICYINLDVTAIRAWYIADVCLHIHVATDTSSLIMSAAVRSFLADGESAEDTGKRLATPLHRFRARPFFDFMLGSTKNAC